MLGILTTSKVASMIAAAAVSASGAGAAAAYAGILPAGLQQIAHQAIGAPAPTGAADAADEVQQGGDDPSESGSVSPSGSSSESASSAAPSASGSESAGGQNGVGPDATGPAAFGLCTAFLHGGLGAKSVALRNLQQAAGNAVASASSSPDPSASGASDPNAAVAAYCAAVVADKKGTDGADASGQSSTLPGKGHKPKHAAKSHHAHGPAAGASAG